MNLHISLLWGNFLTSCGTLGSQRLCFRQLIMIWSEPHNESSMYVQTQSRNVRTNCWTLITDNCRNVIPCYTFLCIVGDVVLSDPWKWSTPFSKLIVPIDSYYDVPNMIRGSNCSRSKWHTICGHVGEKYSAVRGGTCSAVFVVVCNVTVDTLAEV
jgi:hypothetical protein